MADNFGLQQLFSSLPANQSRSSRQEAEERALAMARLPFAARVEIPFQVMGDQLGGVLGQAMGNYTPEEKRARTRQAILSKIDPADPDSILAGSKAALDAGDPEAAFAMANEAGRIRDRLLGRQKTEADIKSTQADTGYKEELTKTSKKTRQMMDKEVRSKFSPFEQSLQEMVAAGALDKETANDMSKRYLESLIAANNNRGLSGSSQKPAKGVVATGQSILQAQASMEQAGLTKGMFDNAEEYAAANATVANLATAIIKANDPITTDYNEAVDMVIGLLKDPSTGVLKDTAWLPGDTEYKVDKGAFEKLRERFGIGVGASPAPSPATSVSIPKGIVVKQTK